MSWAAWRAQHSSLLAGGARVAPRTQGTGGALQGAAAAPRSTQPRTPSVVPINATAPNFRAADGPFWKQPRAGTDAISSPRSPEATCSL